MLKKKYTRKSKKFTKYNAKKKFPLSKRIPSLGRNVCGFPDRLRCKLRIVDLVNGGDGIASNFSKVYGINSLFDPLQSAGTIQPLYFQELSAIYSHYIVRGAKITVQYALANSGTGGNSILCSLDLLGLNPNADTNPELIMMRPGTDWKIASTQYPRTKITKYWYPKVATSYNSNDNVNTSSVGGDPIGLQLAKVYMLQMNSGIVPALNSLMFVTTIDFYCEFYGQLPVAISDPLPPV